MNRVATIFLQLVVVVVGIAVFALLLWEPHLEGRNDHATQFEIYFHDPFLAFVYFASSAFFLGLVQAFRVLGYARHGAIFSPEAVNALRIIKYCAMAMLGFVIIGEICILQATGEDRAGGVAIGLAIAVGSIVVATASAMLQQIVQHAVELKSENDLTV